MPGRRGARRPPELSSNGGLSTGAHAAMTTEAFLATVPLFADLAPEHLRLMAGAGRTRTAEAGQVVFREGDASDGLYIVLRGGVRIYKRHDDGAEVDLLIAQTGQ